jgi:T-complex protein 1 subunit theta
MRSLVTLSYGSRFASVATGGLTSLLKDGYKHFSGLDDAVTRNIEACRGLAVITRTSLGPNAMNKLVVNHLEKIFVTSDAATIVQELEVAHPAARMLTMAAKMQEQEMGDGTNFVITFAGSGTLAAFVFLTSEVLTTRSDT